MAKLRTNSEISIPHSVSPLLHRYIFPGFQDKTSDTSRYTGKFKLVMLESGHFPQRENPRALCAELLPFLTAPE
jgi:hypothetical protein